MPIILGCIADDFTGGTDLANTLVKQGMRTLQLNGVPDQEIDVTDVDAVIISLKCRSIPAAEAIRQCIEALSWLQHQGCQQFFWKYCSTFDSSAEGNIGPVAEALQKVLKCTVSIVCPAFPENKRTIYNGYLFVDDILLSESGMRNHPVTPMKDSNLVRLLKSQVQSDVGLLKLETIQRGVSAVKKALSDFSKQNISFVVADAVNNHDLVVIGAACHDMPLITGGSGIALGLPYNYQQKNLIPKKGIAAHSRLIKGKAIILSGSCSEATRQQIENFQKHDFPMFKLDPAKLAASQEYILSVLDWIRKEIAEKSVLLYTSDEPGVVSKIQQSLGKLASATSVENAFATIATAMKNEGIRKFIVAGGETSGAVVKALGIPGMHIGQQISPGVPWTYSTGNDPIALALKSGNFGGSDFFIKALQSLPKG